MGHVRDRALERFGIILSGREIVSLLIQVENGSAAVIGHQGSNRTLYTVVLPNGEPAIAVVTRDNHILTLLPPTWNTGTGMSREQYRTQRRRHRGGRRRR